MYKVIFIAHGSSNIGMGHVIRSMSLANAFRDKNYEVKFISKYETGKKTLFENDFDVISIDGKEINTNGFYYGSIEELEEDLKAIKKILEVEKPDIIVVDSYNVTKEFFVESANYTKCTAYIDDTAAFDYPVDVIINGNISAKSLQYENFTDNPKLLLGLKYNLIRREFNNVPKRNVTDNCNSIMVSTGAADPHNITKIILDKLLSNNSLSGYAINVVIGKGFKEDVVKQIKSIALSHPTVVLHENPPKMSEIMLQSDFAITAGGSTIYELFACGVVTFAFIYAENQRDLVEVSEKNGYLFNLGNYNEMKTDIANCIIEVAKDTSLRKNMVEQIQAVVDSQGTKRIVEEVEKLILEKCNL